LVRDIEVNKAYKAYRLQDAIRIRSEGASGGFSNSSQGQGPPIFVRNFMRIKASVYLLAAFVLCCTPLLSHAQITINTTTASDWKIANGAISMDWDSTTGNVWSMYLTAYPSDNLVDLTHSGTDGNPAGLYMDNTGTNMAGNGPTGVTPTASYHQDGQVYLDWWISWAATASSPFTWTVHYVVQPNDPTLYTYIVAGHSSTAAAASMTQIQYVYRVSQTDFTNTYSVNSGLNNLGATAFVLPSSADMWTTDPGRQVQNGCVDLHGFSLPAGFGREFETKYDTSAYEYLHQAHGMYGSTFGAWTILPSTESLSGGPTKQDLMLTDNILMGEVFSGHFNSDLFYVPTQGENTTRIFGPIGFHFNAFNGIITTPAEMYQDAVNTIPSALNLFAEEGELGSNGYVPNGTKRGTVSAIVNQGGSSTSNTAWAVLGDQNKNHQYSTNGYTYWADGNSSGAATLSNVVPGTYRLSWYVLGQYGELRVDGVSVTAGNTTSITGLTFKPENFSPSGDSAIWTIGNPTRSSNKFLHGKNNYGDTGSCSGCDDREYYGNWNYWADFAANDGAVVYYATAVGSHAATNNLLAWNYNQWGQFDPGLYDAANDTTDNYVNTIPTYVKSLPGASGTNGVTTPVPEWTVNFAATSAQMAQGSYVDLSVALAAADASLTVSLNGKPITWHSINTNDAAIRSGFSGYTQWIVFEWPTSDLVSAGGDNVLTFSVSGGTGVMYDALRMEISAAGANPTTTNWHDYEYVTPTTYTAADDAVANN
jgi:hypothetical protein